MTADEFIKFIINEITKGGDSFVGNMNNLGVEEKYPHEWMDILSRWLELSCEEDARYFYGYLYDG